jgi:peroxiredoxin family protein
MSLGARLLDKYFERAETWEDITRANYLSLAHSLVSIGAAVAVFFVVRGLHEIQQRHCNEGRPLMPGM